MGIENKLIIKLVNIVRNSNPTKLVRRVFLICIFLTYTLIVLSQELSIGGFGATNWKVETSSEILGFGANIEYRPNKSVVSINSDILIFYVNNGSITTFPLYIKIIIGNKLRVCPTFGGFIRTNENYGYSAGISVDYKVSEKLLLYLKTEYMRDYWPDRYIKWGSYNYVGGKRINSKTGYSIWFNFGFKINILKIKN